MNLRVLSTILLVACVLTLSLAAPLPGERDEAILQEIRTLLASENGDDDETSTTVPPPTSSPSTQPTSTPAPNGRNEGTQSAIFACYPLQPIYGWASTQQGGQGYVLVHQDEKGFSQQGGQGYILRVQEFATGQSNERAFLQQGGQGYLQSDDASSQQFGGPFGGGYVQSKGALTQQGGQAYMQNKGATSQQGGQGYLQQGGRNKVVSSQQGGQGYMQPWPPAH